MTRLTDDALAAIRARVTGRADSTPTSDVLDARDLLAHIAALDGELAKESARVGDWIRAHEAAREERFREVLRGDELARENTALAAKLAEVERERDEALLSRDHLRAELTSVQTTALYQVAERLRGIEPERDAALAEQRRLAAIIERADHTSATAMSAQWEASERENDRLAAALTAAATALETTAEWVRREGIAGTAAGIMADAQEARAALAPPQPPAVDREASLDELARLSQEFGGYEELREPGNAEVVSAIRALPDEEPPSAQTHFLRIRPEDAPRNPRPDIWKKGRWRLRLERPVEENAVLAEEKTHAEQVGNPNANFLEPADSITLTEAESRWLHRSLGEMLGAIPDERRDIEQRTAEAIAEMLDERRRDIEASKMFGATDDDPVSIACDAYYDGRIQAFTDAAALVRSRRTP